MLNRRTLVLIACIDIFFHACCLKPAIAFQWPQFGGPQRDFALDREPFNVSEFAADQLWQVEVGDGKSGVVVDETSVFVCFRRDKPTGESAENTKYLEGIAALDRQTGEQRWVHQYDCEDLEEQQSFSGDPRSPRQPLPWPEIGSSRWVLPGGWSA